MVAVSIPNGQTSMDQIWRQRGFVVLLTAAICAYLGLISLFSVGFQGSDDFLYWQGAGGWLAHVPYLGTSHWSLRHTLVIPMAITRLAFGNGMLAMLLPSLLYALGLIVVLSLWTRRAAGLAASTAAVALIVTNPQFVLLSSTANVDMVELFFILSAFALIHAAMDRTGMHRTEGGWNLLLLAGVSIGLAMLSRETTAFAVAAIGLLFLAGYGMHRARYFIIGIGFCCVVGLELAYFWAMTGNPLYRYAISGNHDSTINRWVEQGAAIPTLHPAIDPFTMLLLNHNFGLIAWVGIPLAIWLIRRGELDAPARRMAVLAIALALTWSVLAAGLWRLLPLTPRYFVLPSVIMSMLSGVALVRMWQRGWRRVPVLLGVLLVGVNILSLSLDNRNYMYGERTLVDIASREAVPIHTDPQTLRRAALLLEWKGVADRVMSGPPEPGGLFYYNPARASVRPQADWIVIERHGLPPTIGQWVVGHVIPADRLSPALLSKLGRGHPDVTLYSVP